LPRDLRPAFSALWRLDLAFADMVATSSDPRLGAIRMAWWRERLDELDAGKRAPSEPRLQAVAAELMPRGISGHELSQLEDAWLSLLEPFPWGEGAAEGLALRGRILFGVGARLLGESPSGGEAAGAFWSLADGALHCSDPPSREQLSRHAQELLATLPTKASPRLRPMTVLAALAAVDLVRRGQGFSRLSAAVRHKLSGAMPRS
jgi:phytoene synthase